MITVWHVGNLLDTIAINETPASWMIKWGDFGNDARNSQKHILFAIQITEDEYTRLKELR